MAEDIRDKGTDRRGVFVLEYLKDLNGTQAAIRAGYSEHTARVIAQELMAREDVRDAIAQAMLDRQARTLVVVDRVLDELAVVGFSSIADYEIDDNGHVALSPTARPDAIRAVSSIKRKRRIIKQKDEPDIVEVETEIKLWDKPSTLRLTGQHLGMYIEKREITLPKGTGVLAVPVPPGADQWAAGAAAQQASLVAGKSEESPT